jgi:hypothetical protein
MQQCNIIHKILKLFDNYKKPSETKQTTKVPKYFTFNDADMKLSRNNINPISKHFNTKN